MWAGVQKDDPNWPRIWALAAPLIESSLVLGQGEFSLRDIEIACLTGEMQLWIIGNSAEAWGAVITQLQVYPQKRYLYILWAGWTEEYSFHPMRKEIEPVLRAYAAELECDGIRAFPRAGIAALLGKKGWRALDTLVEYKL